MSFQSLANKHVRGIPVYEPGRPIQEVARVFPGSAIQSVRADVHRPDGVGFDVENDPQVTFNYGRVNGFLVSRREGMDFVRAQACVERILLEDVSGATD